MRVLIAVDGSEGSLEAVRQISPLLKPEQDDVALYCHPPRIAPHSMQASSDVLEKASDSMANAIFAAARQHLPGEFKKISTIVGEQDPKRGIVLAAEQFSAGLVVMGARGLGVFQRLVLGSVSQAVVHSCRAPVWVARRKSSKLQGGSRVLLAHRTSDADKASMNLLGQLAWPENTVANFLTVVPSLFPGNVPEWLQQQARSPEFEAMAQAWVREHEQEKEQCLNQLRNYIRILPSPFNQARSSVVEGDPANEILAVIARESIDLVVIGTHMKRSMIGTWLGSTANTVLNHADCSVLLVPTRENP